MNKDSLRKHEFIFRFTATRFSGLSHKDESRRESIIVRARSFTDAIEQLRKKLHDFRGSNSFGGFTVETFGGSWTVSTNPDLLFDIFDVLDHALFTLGKQIVAVR